MARPTKPAAVKLTKTVRYRVTDADFARLEQDATDTGLSIADYCRARDLGTKPRRKKASPQRLALIGSLGQLGHIRSDINKLLKDRWAYKFIKPEQVERVFAQIEAIADTIQNDLENGH